MNLAFLLLSYQESAICNVNSVVPLNMFPESPENDLNTISNHILLI